MSRRLPLGILITSVLLQGKVAASAIELEHYEAKRLVSEGQILSLDATLKRVAAFCQGKLLDAHLYQDGDSWRYDLQFGFQRGEITHLSVDASSGKLSPDSELPDECQTHETATR
ncbi:PepSY domain-containing protein [Shewanella sp.]|uniref:PepSY domain-containing protein n=1 Tax=Shewanella sp. TaxID=50422 RepID=UPI0035676DD5